MDSLGNKSEADPDTLGNIPANKDIFLENVNPGVTRPGEVIFTVPPDASGFKLQVGDTNPFTDKNGYVDLGFSASLEMSRGTEDTASLRINLHGMRDGRGTL
jgi:hypothetical protein